MEIPGGAPAATLQQAAAFAWQEFIAANWPALAGQRDIPIPVRNSAPAAARWCGRRSAARSRFSTSPRRAAGGFAPPGYSATDPYFGYGTTPPAYYYATRLVPACKGQGLPPSPAWINLDETTQIELDQMFAGGPAMNDSANTSPQLIRFAVKANRVEYDYVAKNQYYLPGNVKTAGREQCTGLYEASTDRAKTAFHQFPGRDRRDQKRLAPAQRQRQSGPLPYADRALLREQG